jgi:hypothetical protein
VHARGVQRIKEKLKHGSASFAILSRSRGEKLAAEKVSFLLSGFRFRRLFNAVGAGGCPSHW